MTPSALPASSSRENIVRAIPGALMLVVNLALIFTGLTLFILGVKSVADTNRFHFFLLLGPLLKVTGIILLTGHFTLQPNEARVLILFGRYAGTVRNSGFHWANPFYTRVRSRVSAPPGESSHAQLGARGGMNYRVLGAKISLRARNFISDKLKVNDKRGNPVEIAAVIVWKVEDT